jgi:Protein of unknown function (DUF1091)
MDSKIIFERYETEENPHIIRTNISFSADFSAVSVHATVLKAYNVKIFVKLHKLKKDNSLINYVLFQFKVVVLQKIASNKVRLIVATPKINYCDLTKGMQNYPLVTRFFTELSKRKNNTMSCPVCPKTYYVNGFGVNETTFPLLSVLINDAYYVTSIAVTQAPNTSSIILYKK